MMKLYRPLCADVTLRLAVDITPDYDEDDEETQYQENNFTTDSISASDGTHPATSTKLSSNFIPYSSASPFAPTCSSPKNKSQEHTNNNHNNSSRESRCSANSLQNINTRNNNPIPQHDAHNKHCSFYSRQNTPDKTAKDIYNHEHVQDGGTGEDFKHVHLDSEFKRKVEETGNDFKGVSIFDELNDSDNNLSDVKEDNGNIDNGCDCGSLYDDGRKRNSVSSEYRDAQLSTSIKETSFFDSQNTTCGCTAFPDDRSSNSDTAHLQDDDMDVCGSTSGLSSDSTDFEHHLDLSVSDPEQIDFDEDVDVIDKQMISSAMGASFYGEIEQEMMQSIHEQAIPDEMTKSIAEEIHEVIEQDGEQISDVVSKNNDVGTKQLPFAYPFTLKHVGYLFEKSRHYFTSTSTPSSSKNQKSSHKKSRSYLKSSIASSRGAQREKEDYDKTKAQKPDKNIARCSVSTMTAVSNLELEVTHRGLHRFIPRHKDEMNIGIGDPIHVTNEYDDLWCEGINLRTGERGIFPAMYANDLMFLEESDEEEEYWKFSMRFLGSVEVISHKGDETLVQAINQVAASYKGNVLAASLSTLEINQYGIRMIDKSKEGHEKDDGFSHFFALKNISFCGTHPKNNRYFAFITKHPRLYKFACHVFHGDRPTHRARDALGEAFKRFYQEYMAFTHPTEDIYME